MSSMEESPKKRSRPHVPNRSRGLSNGSMSSIGSSAVGRDRSSSVLIERDAQISALEQEVTMLQNKLSTLTREYHSRPSVGPGGPMRRRHHPLSPYGHHVHETTSKSSGRRKLLHHQRARMGRNASVATAAVLNALPDDGVGGGTGAAPTEDGGGGGVGAGPGGKPSSTANIIHRIAEMFKDPASHMTYLNSAKFAKDILKLNSKVRPLLESEPRVAFLQSPAYVFGDIHGNLEDLHFFSDNIWRLGMALTAGNFVFLGDYVDRGMSCLECVAYLLSMKLTLPHKVYLLRGNHETRDVNGWEEHYGVRSFLWQCRDRFGDELGYRVWEATNQTFDRMPLAAVIDQDIFCVHGGIPRPIADGISDVDVDDEEGEDEGDGDEDEDGTGRSGRKPSISSAIKGTRIQDILTVPTVAGINPPFEHEDEDHQQVASDCIWSDPASEEQERTGVDPATGFGDSLRGGGAICFGHRAVTDFLQQQGLSYIMRAHEAHAEGVAVSKGARVFTVFSTSKDHNQGSQAMAGCILVDFEKMQVINRSPAYRNQYVHRRDSVSVARLSEGEIEKRIKLGLVTPELGGEVEGQQEEEYDDEQYLEEETWEDLVEDDDVETDDNEDDVEYGGRRSSSEDSLTVGSFRGRKSSVNPTETHASPLGASHDNHVWAEFDDSRDRSDSNSTAGTAGSAGSLDYANVEMGERVSKRAPLGGFSAIQEEEEEEEEEDEESTVDGRTSQDTTSVDDQMDVSSALGGVNTSRGGRRAKASF